MNYNLLEACEDTDKGLKDYHGKGCDAYTWNTQYCGNYDGNEGFVSNQMCCACGGGNTSGDSGKY